MKNLCPRRELQVKQFVALQQKKKKRKKEETKISICQSYCIDWNYLLYRSSKINKERYTSIIISRENIPTFRALNISVLRAGIKDDIREWIRFDVVPWREQRRLSLVFGLSSSALKIARWKLRGGRASSRVRTFYLTQNLRLCKTHAFNVPSDGISTTRRKYPSRGGLTFCRKFYGNMWMVRVYFY